MAQKSLLSIIQTASAQLNLPTPSAIFSSTNGNDQKLLALCRAVCEDLLLVWDWQFLNQRYSFTTTAGVDNYPFPTDLSRYINGTFWDSTSRWPLKGPKTAREWEMAINGFAAAGAFERFRVFGNRFYVTPAPTTPHTFAMEYVSNSYVLDANTMMAKQDFAQDADICMFPSNLVVYGIKYKWKASNEQDTSEALTDYTRTLELLKGVDMPAPVLSLSNDIGFQMLSTNNFPDGSWTV